MCFPTLGRECGFGKMIEAAACRLCELAGGIWDEDNPQAPVGVDRCFGHGGAGFHLWL
jgi:hypothetical protein